MAAWFCRLQFLKAQSGSTTRSVASSFHSAAFFAVILSGEKGFFRPLMRNWKCVEPKTSCRTCGTISAWKRMNFPQARIATREVESVAFPGHSSRSWRCLTENCSASPTGPALPLHFGDAGRLNSKDEMWEVAFQSPFGKLRSTFLSYSYRNL